jgi:hypothetical protein
MTLKTHAYLEIEGASDTATFELNIGLTNSSDITKSYLMGKRGQYLREVVNQTPNTGSFDEGRRTGFWIDGGAGNWEESFQFKPGPEDVQWGDGSGGDGQSNVTKTDASGSNVKAITRKQVLDYWVAKSKSDSNGDTRIHWGEWTDGSIANISSASIDAGVFGQAMPIAIQQHQISLADPDQNEVGIIEGNMTVAHVDLWGGDGAPDWVDDSIGAVTNAADIIPDA